ncbi:MAG: 6-phosphogluconolactonase [Anaerolineaceae bacterium]|nr:6-phosphogluconolactonase [Anaerolineaceae bacterium]
MRRLEIVSNKEELTQQAVEIFIQAAHDQIRENGSFSVALSGGGTPKPVYAELAKPENSERVDWEKVHLFWGDERHVPPEDDQSNFKMVREALLDQIEIPAENVHRVRTEMDVRMAAFQYEEELRQFFNGEWPVFDFVFLGMGNDGHTASLFPKSAGLNEEYRWFIANYAPSMDTWRLTLTAPAINAARFILVLVAGESKAERLKAVLEGPKEPYELPIQMIDPNEGEMLWLVDQAAASGIKEDLL